MKLAEFLFSDVIIDGALSIDKSPKDESANGIVLTLKDGPIVEYIPTLHGLDLRLSVLFDGVLVYTSSVVPGDTTCVSYDTIMKFWNTATQKMWEANEAIQQKNRISAARHLNILAEKY